MQKAIVQSISYAGMEFEGLMLPDGSYRIALIQISRLFLKSRKVSQNQLKALTGVDFQSHTIATELTNQKSKTLSLDDFSLLVAALAQKGNSIAVQFAIASVTEKLERIFDDAFGKEVDERDREARFKLRLQHKKQWRPNLTDHYKKDGVENYGKEVNKFKRAANLPIKSIEKYDTEEVQKMNDAEVIYDFLRRKGYSHEQALRDLDVK